MIAEIALGLSTAGLTVGLVKLIFNNARAIKDSNELATKVITLTKTQGEVNLDLSQVTANRDLLRTTIGELGAENERLLIRAELAEGHRDDLLKEIAKNPEKLDPEGKLVAVGINSDIELLKKLSKVPTKPGGGG